VEQQQQQRGAAHKTQRRRLNFITSSKNLAAATKQRGIVFWAGQDITHEWESTFYRLVALGPCTLTHAAKQEHNEYGRFEGFMRSINMIKTNLGSSALRWRKAVKLLSGLRTSSSI